MVSFSLKEQDTAVACCEGGSQRDENVLYALRVGRPSAAKDCALHPVQRSAAGTEGIPQDLDLQHKYAIRAVVSVVELYKIRSLLYVGCADMGWFRVALETFTASDKGFR